MNTKQEAKYQLAVKNEKRGSLLLFLILFLFIFIGCQDPFTHDSNLFPGPAGKGSFSLTFSDTSRTILPAAPGLNSFAVYSLNFTPVNGGKAASEDRTNETFDTNPIYLDPGTYNLVVNAYRDNAKNQLAARGTLNGIVISSGVKTSAAITLEALISGGTGTFRWEINLPSGVTANMTITPWSAGGTNQEAVALNPPKASGSRTLNSGQYSLTFSLTKTDGKSVVWNELLYVYQSLESVFTYSFSDNHLNDSAYTVTYNFNDGVTGSKTQSVLHGALLTRPDTPARNGYIFTGWFTDAALANPWNFDSPVTASLALYAKWEIMAITGVSIAVMPPVVGAAPINRAYGTGNFTIGDVSWTPSHNPFQDNTPYTATVALTAGNGYTFTGLNSATVNEQNAVITTNTGTVVILSYVFPATDDTAVNKFLANSYVGNDRIKYSFSYGKYDFYYIYLGGMANIPIYTFPVKQHNGQPGNIYTVSMSNQTITTVENTVTTHVEDTKTAIEEYSYSATTGWKLKEEVGLKVSALWGLVSADVGKISAEAYWQDYIANNTTLINQQKTSLTSTVKHATTSAYSYTVSDSFDLGYRKAGYYRYTMFSVSDVYLYVIKDSRVNELVYYEFKEHIVPNAFFWALDYSDTPSFTKSDATRFSLDISVLDNLPKTALHFGFPVSNTAQWNDALAVIRNNGSGTAAAPKTYDIIIFGDVAVPGSTSNDTSLGSVQHVEVTLAGDGKLSLSSNGSILRLGSNQKLIIDDEHLTLQGRNGNDNAVLYAETGGTLELKNGVITGNTSSGRGGGVNVTGLGTFTMNGGTITGNTASSVGGGGVYMLSGTLTMNGGTITGNTASSSSIGGGGVYFTGKSFTMNGGTISGNTASGNSNTGRGGGVYIISSGFFNMMGGTISGNTASYGGGGVYAEGVAFNMTGGTISGNTAFYGGGGVYLIGRAFLMSGGIITGNTASSVGGGVYISGGYFSISGGTMTGYNSEANGNVVKNNNGAIQSNKGHAVYASSNSITKRKETNAGNLSFNGTVDPPTFSGWWDY